MTFRSCLCITVLSFSSLVAAQAPGVENFQQGVATFEAADYPAAVAALEQLHGSPYANADFNYYYALSLFKTNQNERAIDAMQQAIELSPRNADYHFALGLIYSARMSELSLLRAARMIGAAKHALEKAVELNPAHAAATRALAELLLDVPGMMGGDKAGAQNLIDTLKTLDPASAAFLEAKLANRSGDLARVEQLLLQAVATPDSAALFRLKLARFYLDQENYEQALHFGEEYLRLPKHWSDFASDVAFAHAWLAIACHEVGDMAQSQQHSQAVDLDSLPKRIRKEIEDGYGKAGMAW